MMQLQTFRACRVVATSNSTQQWNTGSERQADGGTRRRSPLLFALMKQSTSVKQRTHRALHARRMAAAAAGRQHKPLSVKLAAGHVVYTRAPNSRCHTLPVT